ncbi:MULTISPECIES: TolB family protein [unclassified Rathayibacter]|uniref:TolB family protein n=1 Tax=unclassified Rathayibacter TaxID=2609250 RepID=UPI000FA053ED|nr:MULTISPECIES: TolB family protein [unclassified Rathayibacter]ROP49159.1 WD40 repeat protein [Rathayibacter sp. PhB186]ROS50724.1 WD40 repeat protein [Rathayibacter sp. PhB185]
MTLGQFEDHGDIGEVSKYGTATFEDGRYRVSGAGTNMWFDRDAFHFVWTRVTGDVSLAADVTFEGDGADPHRKAVLVVRAGLGAGAVYADAALHGDGLTSLQFRTAAGGVTREVRSVRSAERRLEIRRRGRTISTVVDGRPAGGAVRLDLPDEYWVGLGVCSHRDDVMETAVFSDVVLTAVDSTPTRLFSTIETIDISSTDRTVAAVVDRWVEAPNWTRTDDLIVNGEGHLYRVPVTGGELVEIDTGSAIACNNDHGLSPDGSRIAISDQSTEDGLSVIYTLPSTGGEPVRITDQSPSYWHGWSPDGTMLAYCAQRNESFGIFTVPAEGGIEQRLTTAVHLDDGPDYSPDGEWIYFNSDRTGRMQIHRVRPDGSDLERVLISGTADWFPHLSPDGRWMVHLSYAPDVVGHPRDHDVTLVLTDRSNGSSRTIADVFGGQGTLNVPSWSPDSTRFAFVSYAYL